MSSCRALHFVLKIGNLKKNVNFFRDVLKMMVLRHEVFEQGCEAACNGPYSGKWSKTMIGYGPEDDNFVLELTYNYTIGSYNLGNDLRYIKIGMEQSLYDQVIQYEGVNKTIQPITLKSPDGYQFQLVTSKQNHIQEICLSSTNLKNSLTYWVDLLGMHQVDGSNDESYARLRYDEHQAHLAFKTLNEPLDHKSAYGRIAFSCPSNQLKKIQKSAEEANRKILTPYLSLDTPGKATVQVVILADPDGHEICFVGDEGFRQLSQVDSKANELIEKSILEDKSDEWFEKKHLKKEQA